MRWPFLSRRADRSASFNGSPATGEERRVQQIGQELLESARSHERGLLSRAFWSDKLMNWAMKDEAFKVQLFRFVDAFPTLKTPDQIHEHLVDYLSQPGVSPPAGLNLGLKAAGVGGLAKGAMAGTMASQITTMAEKFIAGVDAESALPKLRQRWENGLAFSVDLLGEACISDREADDYQRKYLDLIETLPTHVNDWPTNARLERDHLGLVPRTNVSLKISSLSARTDPIAFEHVIERTLEKIEPILHAAAKRSVFINFDMEAFATKDLTIELFTRCCERVEFEGGVAIQAYLRSGDADAQKLIDWSRRTGRQITVRLVKGAYWDYETIHAEQMGWPIPVWSRKADTDACFERMAKAFIDATPRTEGEGGVKLALGSHNVRSIAAGLAELEKQDLPTSAIELQMLHGMADPLKAAAVERGLRVREYVPVGEMVPGMAYLVRRLLENTSNESWLRAGFVDEASVDELLAPPHVDSLKSGLTALRPSPAAADQHALTPSVEGVGDGRPFFNEPLLDFSIAENRQRFASTIEQTRVQPVANDGTAEQADRMVATAADTFPSWRDTDPRERANCLTRAANLLRQRRLDLAALVLRENGKDWRNADADVCEAIDFCEFYAREAVRLFEPQRLGHFIGELNEQWHEPRGVCAVISPWNFPIAIACGMTTAALVTGNCVILKPAEQTPAIAKVLCEILWEAGVPRDVLHFLPGKGETVGAHLVRHERVDMVAFTGSAAVGRDILQSAATHPPKGKLARHVVCETGGKNAIIVDASADLDEAVVGVRDSAFGFQGQKCSACSRAIVVESAHDAFIARLIEATRSLTPGDPADPATDIGPVIDREAADNIRAYIEIGKQEGQLAYPTEAEAAAPHLRIFEQQVGKPYLLPHIFTNVAPHHRIATEEIFGPVLAILRVPDFDTALQVANAPGYKLTGGLYSRKPSHLEQARRQFRVGNLYLNRGITGALVARQPFGGFGLSGLGTKAGGRDYLLQFVQPRACTENTMRRGFAPALDEPAGTLASQSAQTTAGE